MKKLLILFFASILSFSLLGSVAFAQQGDSGNASDTLISPGNASKKSILDKAQERRCERIQARVQTRAEGYDKNKEKHIQRFNNLEKRLSVLIAKLKSFGLNTSKLEADLVTLKTMTTEYMNSYNQFSEIMKGTKDLACDTNGTASQFKNSVSEAKRYLKQTREKGSEIGTFVKVTIKADLLELKAQALDLKLSTSK